MDRLNADRAAADLAPLGSDPRLEAAARDVAAEVTQAGSVDAVRIDGDSVAVHLREHGYLHRLLVIAYAGGVEERQLSEQWSAFDPGSWRRMLQPELQDVALARGSTLEGPFYLLLAAVSQDDAKAQEAQQLSDLESVRTEVLELTNAHRKSEQRLKLKAEPDLDRIAQGYAEEMLRRGFYGHTSPEGDDVMRRMKRDRFFVRRAGENLAEGPPTARAVVKSWYDSPPHRENLLHDSFRKMGLGVAAGKGPDGVYKIIWVQVFTSERRPTL